MAERGAPERMRKTADLLSSVPCDVVIGCGDFVQFRMSPTTPLPESLVVGNANEVLKLFAEHKLLMVLQGHLHVNEHIAWNDMDFILGGAVCGGWWDGDNLGTGPGFGLVEIGPPQAGWTYTESKV